MASDVRWLTRGPSPPGRYGGRTRPWWPRRLPRAQAGRCSRRSASVEGRRDQGRRCWRAAAGSASRTQGSGLAAGLGTAVTRHCAREAAGPGRWSRRTEIVAGRTRCPRWGRVPAATRTRPDTSRRSATSASATGDQDSPFGGGVGSARTRPEPSDRARGRSPKGRRHPRPIQPGTRRSRASKRPETGLVSSGRAMHVHRSVIGRLARGFPVGGRRPGLRPSSLSPIAPPAVDVGEGPVPG